MEKQIKNSVKKAKIIQEKMDESVDVFAIGVCPNPVWLRGMTKDSAKCAIRVPKASMRNSLVGKWMKATRIDGGEENHYKFLA
tara:strand:+ start:231 stop:479 length:249 start_codon:yes stop_codon:yes gene_type:complete